MGGRRGRRGARHPLRAGGREETAAAAESAAAGGQAILLRGGAAAEERHAPTAGGTRPESRAGHSLRRPRSAAHGAPTFRAEDPGNLVRGCVADGGVLVEGTGRDREGSQTAIGDESEPSVKRVVTCR